MTTKNLFLTLVVLLFLFDGSVDAQDYKRSTQFLNSKKTRLGVRSVVACIAKENSKNIDNRINMSKAMITNWNKIRQCNLATAILAESNSKISDARLVRLNRKLLTKLAKNQVQDQSSVFYGSIPRDESSKGDLVTTFFFCEAVRNEATMKDSISKAILFVLACKKKAGDSKHDIFVFSPDNKVESDRDTREFLYPSLLGLCLIEKHGSIKAKNSIAQMKVDISLILKERIEEGKLSFHEFYAISIGISKGVLNIPESHVNKMKKNLSEMQNKNGSWHGKTWFDSDSIVATSLCVLAFKNLEKEKTK